MVETIKSLKDTLLRHMEKDISERGAEYMDPKMVDMVKDLAEAEKECWEAEYYRNAAEGMESRMGYDNMMGFSPETMSYGYGSQGGQGGQSGSQGYSQGSGGGNSRSGWANQYGRGSYARRGYGSMGHQDAEEGIFSILQTAKPEEKDRIKQMLKRELGM